jgi:hypothetical protein
MDLIDRLLILGRELKDKECAMMYYITDKESVLLIELHECLELWHEFYTTLDIISNRKLIQYMDGVVANVEKYFIQTSIRKASKERIAKKDRRRKTKRS